MGHLWAYTDRTCRSIPEHVHIHNVDSYRWRAAYQCGRLYNTAERRVWGINMDTVKMVAAGIGGLILVYLLVYYSSGSIGLANEGFTGVVNVTKALQGRG